MDMSSLFVIYVVIFVVILSVLIPFTYKQMRSGKKPSGGYSSAFGVIDDLFHPSAAEMREASEEMQEAVAPMPSADDKPFDDGHITINLAKEPPATR